MTHRRAYGSSLLETTEARDTCVCVCACSSPRSEQVEEEEEDEAEADFLASAAASYAWPNGLRSTLTLAFILKAFTHRRAYGSSMLESTEACDEEEVDFLGSAVVVLSFKALLTLYAAFLALALLALALRGFSSLGWSSAVGGSSWSITVTPLPAGVVP